MNTNNLDALLGAAFELERLIDVQPDAEGVTIRVNTVGDSQEITASPEEPLAEALENAGVDVNVQGLSGRVNGEDVDPQSAKWSRTSPRSRSITCAPTTWGRSMTRAALRRRMRPSDGSHVAPAWEEAPIVLCDGAPVALDSRPVAGAHYIVVPAGARLAAEQLGPYREPGPAAIAKAIDSLVAGLNHRTGKRWRVVASPLDGLEGAATVRAGEVEGAGIVRPDDPDAIGDGGAAGTPTDEDDPDRRGERVTEPIAVE